MIQKLKQIVVNLLRKNMKVGVSYNLFDCEELLEASIKCIRKNVNYINIIYQTISNYGNPASPELKDKLNKLKEKGLIDEIYYFEPNLKKTPHENEIKKRDLGLKLAKKHGCTHFMSMDADEFYDEEQFNKALNQIAIHNIKSSAVGIVEYLKEPENQILGAYAFTPDEIDLYNYYVPFIIKISKFKKQRHGKGYFPCLTDPTRTLFHSGRFKLFSTHKIAMHHMSTVRLDLSKKYANSSLMDSEKKYQEQVKELQQEILNFDFEKNKKLPDNCSIFKGILVKKVENKFKIEL